MGKSKTLHPESHECDMKLACSVWSLTASSPVQHAAAAPEAAEPGLVAAAPAGNKIADKPSADALADCRALWQSSPAAEVSQGPAMHVRKQNMLLPCNTTRAYSLMVGQQ